MRIFVTAVTITLFWLLTASCQTPPYSLVTTSPSRTYTVKLMEQKRPIKEPMYDHVVGLRVFTGARQIIDEPLFFAGDSFDQRFAMEYPEHEWITDDLLRFGKKIISANVITDIVLVNNDGKSEVAYLMVRAGSEMLLLFDIQPGAAITLKAGRQADQRADLKWIGYGGQFSDGRKIRSGGVDFRLSGKYQIPGHYCITVTDDDVIV